MSHKITFRIRNAPQKIYLSRRLSPVRDLKVNKIEETCILKISNTVSLTTPFSSMLFLQSISAWSCLCGLTAAMTSTILSAMLSTSSTLLTQRFSRFILPQDFSQFSSTDLEGIILLLLCTKQGRISNYNLYLNSSRILCYFKIF